MTIDLAVCRIKDLQLTCLPTLPSVQNLVCRWRMKIYKLSLYSHSITRPHILCNSIYCNDVPGRICRTHSNKYSTFKRIIGNKESIKALHFVRLSERSCCGCSGEKSCTINIRFCIAGPWQENKNEIITPRQHHNVEGIRYRFSRHRQHWYDICP